MRGSLITASLAQSLSRGEAFGIVHYMAIDESVRSSVIVLAHLESAGVYDES